MRDPITETVESLFYTFLFKIVPIFALKKKLKITLSL